MMDTILMLAIGGLLIYVLSQSTQSAAGSATGTSGGGNTGTTPSGISTTPQGLTVGPTGSNIAPGTQQLAIIQNIEQVYPGKMTPVQWNVILQTAGIDLAELPSISQLGAAANSPITLADYIAGHFTLTAGDTGQSVQMSTGSTVTTSTRTLAQTYQWMQQGSTPGGTMRPSQWNQLFFSVTGILPPDTSTFIPHNDPTPIDLPTFWGYFAPAASADLGLHGTREAWVV